MKVSYLIEKESKLAWRQKDKCPKCGSRHYCVCHQLAPKPECWWVMCEECEWESYDAPAREVAIGRWEQEER